MNTNDLPLAQQLAALMEAGRACHPEMKHGRGALKKGDSVCGIGYALLGAGKDPAEFENATWREIAAALGMPPGVEFRAIAGGVVHMNDDTPASIEEIIAATRNGALPQSKVHFPIMPLSFIKSFDTIWFDELSKEIKTKKIEPAKQPAVMVRVGKNGATWPKPKHAYA